MRRGTSFLIASGLLLIAACTRTVVIQPGPDRGDRGSRPPPRAYPEPERPAPPPPRRNEVLIPPGHLPNFGECRVWIPGRAPGRQPRPRSRPCAGIEAIAPAGSWIVYRRADDRRLVYLRVLDERRPGIVIRIRIFDVDSWELLRDDEAREERDDRPRQERPRDERPPENRPPDNRPPENRPPVVQPPAPPPPARDTARPREQRPPMPPIEIIRPVPRDTAPTRPPENRPPENRPPIDQPPPPPPVRDTARPPEQRPPEPPAPPPLAALTLDIPPGHLPEIGECRVWVEGVPPGQQAKPKSRSCDGITSVAPAGSWIVYRPSNDLKVVHVRVVDARRPGVVIRIRVFDLDTRRLLREETP